MEKRYWHFLSEDKRLQFEPRKLVRTGSTMKFDDTPIPCKQGLHASHRAIDALKYAPGPVICRVTLAGAIVECNDKDKFAAQKRTVLWMADATDTLHRFGCRIVTDALKAAHVTERACYDAIAIKLLWLDGLATDDELQAARSAAWSAAESAAWSAAENAARSADRSAQNTILESMLAKLKP